MKYKRGYILRILFFIFILCFNFSYPYYKNPENMLNDNNVTVLLTSDDFEIYSYPENYSDVSKKFYGTMLKAKYFGSDSYRYYYFRIYFIYSLNNVYLEDIGYYLMKDNFYFIISLEEEHLSFVIYSKYLYDKGSYFSTIIYFLNNMGCTAITTKKVFQFYETSYVHKGLILGYAAIKCMYLDYISWSDKADIDKKFKEAIKVLFSSLQGGV